ncbi:TPA: helix-turn-helix domain-containing protein [Pseudomonas aeruginosa]
MKNTQYPDLPWELRWRLIKAAVNAVGESMASIGKRHGLTAVAMVKSKRYPAAQDAIAGTLGVSAAALFPERYVVTWSDHYQRDVEKVLPGLAQHGDTQFPGVSKVKELHAHWRNIPVDLVHLPGTAKSRLAWIRNQLKARGFIITEVARYLGVSRTAINNLVVVAYADVQAFIADCLGVKPQQLWPDRYGEDGVPLPSGRALKSAPYRDAPSSVLDLREGLWLPVESIVGLPGLSASTDGITAAAKRHGWQVRDRAGVAEVAFASLPVETRYHLVGRIDVMGGSPVGRRVRKRFKRTAFELDQLTGGTRKVVAVEVGDGISTVSITSVGAESGKVEAWQHAALTPGELRQIAAALLDAAQVCEIVGD